MWLWVLPPPPIHCYVTVNVFSGQEWVAKRPQLDGLIMGGSHAGASVAGGSKDPASDTVCYARLQHSRPPPAALQAAAAAAAASLRMPVLSPDLGATFPFVSTSES